MNKWLLVLGVFLCLICGHFMAPPDLELSFVAFGVAMFLALDGVHSLGRIANALEAANGKKLNIQFERRWRNWGTW